MNKKVKCTNISLTRLIIICILMVCNCNKLFSQTKSIKYYHLSEFGINVLTKESKAELDPNIVFSKLNFNTANGIMIKEKISLGLFTGIYQLNQVQVKQYLYPLGIESKIYFNKNKSNINFGLSSGYTIGRNALGLIEYQTGIFINPSIGYQYSIYKNLKLHANISYNIQNVSYNVDTNKLENITDPGDPLYSLNSKSFKQLYQIISLNIGIRL